MPDIVIQNAEGEPEVWRDVNTVRFLDEAGGIVSFRHTDPKDVKDTVSQMIMDLRPGEFVVQFVDWFGKPIQTLVHDYGDSATLPDTSMLNGPNDMEFYCWSEDTDYITKSNTFFPIFRFKDVDERTTVFKLSFPVLNGDTTTLLSTERAVSLLIAAVDASSSSNKTIHIDWGDGTVSDYHVTSAGAYSCTHVYDDNVELLSNPIYIKVTSDSENLRFGQKYTTGGYWSSRSATSSSNNYGCFSAGDSKYQGWKFCVAAEFGNNVHIASTDQLLCIGYHVVSVLYKGKLDIAALNAFGGYYYREIQRLFIPKGIGTWYMPAAGTNVSPSPIQTLGFPMSSNTPSPYGWYIKDVDEIKILYHSSSYTGTKYNYPNDNSFYLYALHTNIGNIMEKFSSKMCMPAISLSYCNADYSPELYCNDSILRTVFKCVQTNIQPSVLWGSNIVIDTLLIESSSTSTGTYNICGYSISQSYISLEYFRIMETLQVNNIKLGFDPNTNLACTHNVPSNGLLGVLPVKYLRVGHIDSNPYLILSKLFYGNSRMEKLYMDVVFDEITPFMCQKCVSLKSVEFGDTSKLTKLGTYMFANCGIEDFDIPDTVSTIDTYCFYNTPRLKRIIIPESITTIKSYAFANTNLQNMYVHNSTPPTLESNAISTRSCLAIQLPNNEYAYGGPIIHVPADSVDAYKSASGWSSYKKFIVGDL